ncbi:MAG TPA: hypothetical protein VFG87_26360 [Amycolatopsis sp.]|jgi:hypothetical protein|nr:hypothetical protein [Amycolatopsis sp.]
MEANTGTPGINELARGNDTDARELRANLARFARQADTPGIRRLVSEVLAGHRDVRDVFRTPEFRQIVSSRLANVQTGLAQLTDEQRAEVWNQDRPRTAPEALESLQTPYDPPTTSGPTNETKHWDEEDFSQNSFPS